MSFEGQVLCSGLAETRPLFISPPALVCSGCHKEKHRPGGWSSMNLFFTVLEARSPRSRCQYGQFLPSLKYSFIYFNWRIITLQHCDGFCHTPSWISHRYTRVPSLLTPLLPSSQCGQFLIRAHFMACGQSSSSVPQTAGRERRERGFCGLNWVSFPPLAFITLKP